jgi:hypothetical protein
LSPRRTITEVELAELKARNPCDQAAAKWVKLRPAGAKHIGACPLCNEDPHSPTATEFECDAQSTLIPPML